MYWHVKNGALLFLWLMGIVRSGGGIAWRAVKSGFQAGCWGGSVGAGRCGGGAMGWGWSGGVVSRVWGGIRWGPSQLMHQLYHV